MTAQRVLLTWGFVLLLAWMVVGIYSGPQVIPTRIEKENLYVEALQGLSAGKFEKAEVDLRKGLKMGADSEHKSSAHGHGLCYAFLALFTGLIQPFLGLSKRMKNIAAWALITGSFLHPIGILTEIANEKAGMIMAAIGAPLLIISVVLSLWGLVKYVAPQTRES